MINVQDIGMITGDVPNQNAQIFNDILTFADSDIYFPPGNYYFLSPLNPITKRVVIRGESMGDTVLVRKFTVANEWESFIHIMGPGASLVKNLSINIHRSVDKGIGLTLDAQPHTGPMNGASPDFSVIENVNITHIGDGVLGIWNRALWLHGAQRVAQPEEGKSIGLRDIRVDNVFLFASSHTSLEVNSVHDAYILASCYPAGSGTEIAKISINSYGLSPCNNIIFNSKTKADLDIVSGTFSNSVFIATSYEGGAAPTGFPTVKFL